jgi:hypothetical protein
MITQLRQLMLLMHTRTHVTVVLKLTQGGRLVDYDISTDYRGGIIGFREGFLAAQPLLV